jgi:deazaflavin-dependent oxidoreductase (nitroreductase family)
VNEDELAALDYCYVTTTGRRTGHLHTIEIWYALHGQTVYLLSGGGDQSDWVRNVTVNPTVGLRVGDRDWIARGRIVEPGSQEDALARTLLLQKYTARDPDDLTDWGKTALPVAIDLPA